MNDNDSIEPDPLGPLIDEIAEAIALRDLSREGLTGQKAIDQVFYARDSRHPDWIRTRCYARMIAVGLLLKGYLR
jgi:hypothetical protein